VQRSPEPAPFHPDVNDRVSVGRSSAVKKAPVVPFAPPPGAFAGGRRHVLERNRAKRNAPMRGRIAKTDEGNTDGESYETVTVNRVERCQRSRLYPSLFRLLRSASILLMCR
jgi:hypothetical protein